MVRAAKSIYHFMLTQAQAGKNLLPERHIRCGAQPHCTAHAGAHQGPRCMLCIFGGATLQRGGSYYISA